MNSTCQPDKTVNCGPGMHHNGKQCVNGTAPACQSATQESVAGKCIARCKPGQKRKGSTTQCIDNGQPCPAGQKKDTDNSCIASHTPTTPANPGNKCRTKKECTKGEKCVNSRCQPDKTVNCGPGMHHNGTQCVNGTAPACQSATQESVAGKCIARCKPGQKRKGSTTKCVDDGQPCPAGQKKDTDNSCIALHTHTHTPTHTPGGLSLLSTLLQGLVLPALIAGVPLPRIDLAGNILATSSEDIIAGPLTGLKTSLEKFKEDPLMLNKNLDGAYGDGNGDGGY